MAGTGCLKGRRCWLLKFSIKFSIINEMALERDQHDSSREITGQRAGSRRKQPSHQHLPPLPWCAVAAPPAGQPSIGPINVSFVNLTYPKAQNCFSRVMNHVRTAMHGQTCATMLGRSDGSDDGSYGPLGRRRCTSLKLTLHIDACLVSLPVKTVTQCRCRPQRFGITTRRREILSVFTGAWASAADSPISQTKKKSLRI